jgi:malate dehydrogenase (oxaloacetate-decarboxylating)
MMDFRFHPGGPGGEDLLEVPLTGVALQDCPFFNKSSATTAEERRQLGLLGLLPPHVSNLQDQLARRYREYQDKPTDLERHIYLRELQDRNEVLFYALLNAHITEMLPVVYTPTVGAACQHFSHIYHRPRGLFISYPDRDHIDTILDNRPWREVDVIVVTDGERILGLGDQGVGGMGIPVGKLSLYTLCGGIHPARTLPISLDTGTNNLEKGNDPLYLGWRQQRVRGQEYDDFIEVFIQAVIRKLPRVLLQWEDFGQQNAHRLLDRYRDRLCTFNDDIQGTAAVALAAILAGVRAAGTGLVDQRVVIVGAGSAGTGIANMLMTALGRAGLSESNALSRLWLIDRHGPLTRDMPDLQPFQKRYASAAARLAGMQCSADGGISLLEVVKRVRPTILIGASGQPGLFTREIVTEMASRTEYPIILPLSNPTALSEATPGDLFDWTGGRALVATGSPFAPVSWRGRLLHVSQCNNCYIFPGMGLGVIASRARRVHDEMFLAAAHALADCSPANANPRAPLFPRLEEIRSVSQRIALAVGAEAQRQGLAEATAPAELEQRVAATMWLPRYPRLRKVSV